MKNTHSDVQLYADMMIVEALLCDRGLSKTAQSVGAITDLSGKVEQYFSNNVDPNDKTKSILNMLAPGIIFTTLGMIGLPWWFRGLLALSVRVFHIDIAGIFSSIYDKIKSALLPGQPLTSAQVDQMVTSSVQEHTAPATQEEAAQAAQTLRSKSYSQSVREAKILKLASMDYARIIAEGASPSFFSSFSLKKAATTNILSKVLSWIFRVALASAGFMVAGDIIYKFLNRPNALDNTIQHGVPVSQTAAPPSTSGPAISAVTSTQTKFPLNPSYHPENLNMATSWVEDAPNNQGGIENMLIGFAKDVYQGLDGQENNMRNTAGFQTIADAIEWYNHTSAGGPVVFIPKAFTSKKQIVDHFIDDVAQKAT